MRALLVSGVALFTAVGLFAGGPGSGYHPYGYASRSGYGSVVFPGTGGPPPVGSITNPGFAARLGGQVSGFRPYRGGRGGGYGAGYGGIVAVPVIVGGGYGYYDPGYDPSQMQPGQPAQQVPNITIVMPPQQAQPAPAAQGYYQPQQQPARPSVREYGPDDYGTPNPNSSVQTYQVPAREAAPAPAEDQPMFLIALKDNSIYTASAYWVEGDTLHYITTQGQHNQVSLDLVDRQTSDRLNKGRQFQLRLPPPKE